MLFCAATGLEKVQKIPPDFWLKAGLGILAFVLAIVLLRKLAHVNKFILTFVVVLTCTVMGFKWIYERDEPEFMTPFIEQIAPFFPAKGAYNAKQQTMPSESGKTPKGQKAPPKAPTPVPKR